MDLAASKPSIEMKETHQAFESSEKPMDVDIERVCFGMVCEP